MNLGGAIQINRGVMIALVIFLAIVALLYRSGNSEMRRASQLIREMQRVNLKHILSGAIDATERGGLKVYQVRMSANINEKSKGKTKEGANNPITDGDMKSHIEMYNSLKKSFGNLEIVSEEKTLLDDGSYVSPANIQRRDIEDLNLPDHFYDSHDIVIWIDPLDATQEYTENLQQYVTTMVCVAIRGKPVIGVIHKPFINQTSWAWVDVATNQGLSVAPQSDKLPDPVKIIVSRSHKGEVETVAKNAFGLNSRITGAGGAGFKILEVVSGAEDVYVHTTIIKKWDICPGNAMLEHLHGKMTTLDGHPIDYSSAAEPKNSGGVVASLFNQEFYLDKLKVLTNKV